MHPAYSIIIFTAASGAGYGQVIALALAALAGRPADGAVLSGFIAAFCLVGAGLLASTFHLGRPGRAWRAFSQWRTSWLSREALLALATYAIAGGFAWAWLARPAGDPLLVGLALAAAVAAALTVVCTAMIYASLKPIPAWRNGWVVPVYLALGLASGAAWLAVLDHLFGVGGPFIGRLTAAALAVAIALKLAYWRHIDAPRDGPTPETATGLGALGQVRLLDAPHTAANFVMKEMGYRIAREHGQALRRLALWGGLAPALALTGLATLGADAMTASAALLAAVLTSVGVTIERWLFFAEARHAAMLYYGTTHV